MNLSRYRGFTLLELLIVLVIVGLLVSIVGPNLFKNLDKSKVTTAEAQLDNIAKALDQYRIDTGHYPSSEQGLAALVMAPAGEPKWNGPYMKKAVPPDPWGNPYVYRRPGSNGREYDLLSNGQDGNSSGDGAIVKE